LSTQELMEWQIWYDIEDEERAKRERERNRKR
jgi:hypothetical protein